MSSPTQDQSTFRARGDARTDCRPSDLRSIALAPLSEAEVRDLRRIGREVRTFDLLAIEIMRTQATLAVMPPRDDPEALRGLRRKERLLLLEALSLGTAKPEGMRFAATLTRCVADDGDNLVAMLAAALETDCMRLGLASRRGRTDAPDA